MSPIPLFSNSKYFFGKENKENKISIHLSVSINLYYCIISHLASLHLKACARTPRRRRRYESDSSSWPQYHRHIVMIQFLIYFLIWQPQPCHLVLVPHLTQRKDGQSAFIIMDCLQHRVDTGHMPSNDAKARCLQTNVCCILCLMRGVRNPFCNKNLQTWQLSL